MSPAAKPGHGLFTSAISPALHFQEFRYLPNTWHQSLNIKASPLDYPLMGRTFRLGVHTLGSVWLVAAPRDEEAIQDPNFPLLGQSNMRKERAEGVKTYIANILANDPM